MTERFNGNTSPEYDEPYTDSVKINGREYDVPMYTTDVWEVDKQDVCDAFLELAALRADHHRHDEWMTWAQTYLNDHPDLCKWGSRLDVAIKETLLQRDAEIKRLRADINQASEYVSYLTTNFRSLEWTHDADDWLQRNKENTKGCGE